MNAVRVLAPRFDDRDVEEAFRREQARETAPIARAGIALGVPLWILVAAFLPLATDVDITVVYVAAATMITIDVLSLVTLRGTPSLTRIELTGAASTVANAAAIAAMAVTVSGVTTYIVPGLMLTVLYAVAVFRIRLPIALLPAYAVLVAHLVASVGRVPPGRIAFEVFVIVAMMVIGLIGITVLERSSRVRFQQGRVIEAQREQVNRERAKSDALLRSILPAAIATRLRERPEAVAEELPEVTLLFADLVGFTAMAERLGGPQTAMLLNTLVSRWDVQAAEAGVEKIKTIGDAYFAAAGVPEPQPDHASRVLELAFAIIRVTRETGRAMGEPLSVRVGVHSGPVIAGVIGRTKFSYDLWGDTVNVASRLESSGVPDEVQASAATVALLDGAYEVVPRGEVDLKGKGPMATFLVRRVEVTAASLSDASRPSVESGHA